MKHSTSPRRNRGWAYPGSRIASAAIVSAAALVFAYCALSALFGSAGLYAYKALEARKAAMEANLEELKALNERLSGELEQLMSNPERAAAEARSLGYLRKGEIEVSAGLSKPARSSMDIGRVLPYADPPALDDGVAKALSLALALLVFAALIAPRGRSYRTANRYREGLVQSASLK